MKFVSMARSIPEADLLRQVETTLAELDQGNERKVKPEYVIKRTLKRLEETGSLKRGESAGVPMISLTEGGTEKLHRASVSGGQTILPTQWDGLWRIVILDFESEDKKARDAVRYMLKKANFLCLKQSIWITPHNLEGFVREMKYHMKLTSEIMFVVATQLDPEIQSEVLEYFAMEQIPL